MAPGLLRGQNVPLPDPAVTVRISCAAAVVPLVVAIPPAGPARAAAPGTPALPGVAFGRPAPGRYDVALDPAAAGPGAPRAYVVALALRPEGTARCFGGVRPARDGGLPPAEGATAAVFTLAGLGTETAVSVVEVYRRAAGWRLRAVGQGYADGLAALLADHGVPDPALPDATLPDAPAVDAGETREDGDAPVRHENVRVLHENAAVTRETARHDSAGVLHDNARVLHGNARAPHDDAPAPRQNTAALHAAPHGNPGVPPGPFAGDAPGWSREERLYTQVSGMREDLARRIAAYRSAAGFARGRLDRELDALLADPARRMGPGAEEARAAAGRRYEELTDRARAVLDHDLRQLTEEAGVVEPALPAACADWTAPAWREFRPPETVPIAVRLGETHLPEVPELRLPLLARLPLAFGLWVDPGTGYGGLAPGDAGQAARRAAAMTAALVVRLLACGPAGRLTVHAVDPDELLGAAFAPLTRAGLVRWWPDATEALEDAAHHADLARMAGAAGAEAPRGAERLLVVGGLTGLGDRAVALLRYLADEGPGAGVLPLVVADPADGRRFGPVLDPLWASLLRLTPLPDDHLTDPWVGHAWTFEPTLPPEDEPDGDRVLDRVIGVLSGGARFAGGA